MTYKLERVKQKRGARAQVTTYRVLEDGDVIGKVASDDEAFVDLIQAMLESHERMMARMT